MDPPPYPEPPPAYVEDGRCSENPKPVELSEKEKKCREIFRKFIIIVQFVVILAVVFVIGKDIYKGSKYDRVIQMKGVSFYLIGNETLMINGTELTTPSGGTEYEVILPSYNVTWSNDIYHQELYFKIYLGEEEMLRKSSDDRIDCQGQGTWCLRITTPHKIRGKIIVEYVLMYFRYDSFWISFNRTFLVDQWNRKE